MDIRLTGIQVENPLQHNSAKLHKLNKRLNPVQKQRVWHGRVAKCNAQISDGIQKDFSKKINKNKQNKKKKRRITDNLMEQIEKQCQLKKNKTQFRQKQIQSVANGQQEVVEGRINQKKSIRQG